jgi:hypothetical protein
MMREQRYPLGDLNVLQSESDTDLDDFIGVIDDELNLVHSTPPCPSSASRYCLSEKCLDATFI